MAAPIPELAPVTTATLPTQRSMESTIVKNGDRVTVVCVRLRRFVGFYGSLVSGSWYNLGEVPLDTDVSRAENLERI